jgi:hypothetical protein
LAISEKVNDIDFNGSPSADCLDYRVSRNRLEDLEKTRNIADHDINPELGCVDHNVDRESLVSDIDKFNDVPISLWR